MVPLTPPPHVQYAQSAIREGVGVVVVVVIVVVV